MGQGLSFRLFAVAILVCSAALGGCGRRGPLELPPGAPGQAAQATPQNVEATASRQDAALNQDPNAPPGVIQSPDQVVQVNQSAAQLAARPPARPINAPPVAAKSTFFLDPLL